MVAKRTALVVIDMQRAFMDPGAPSECSQARMIVPVINRLSATVRQAGGTVVPLFVLWFGFGPTSKVVVSAVIAVFPVMISRLLGLRSVEIGHEDVFGALRASRWQRLWQQQLPSAVPAVLAGMEMAVVLATIGAVVGEYLGGSDGLGYFAVATMNAFQTDSLFAIIILLTLMGFLLYAAIAALRRWLLPWHRNAAT